jgi:stage IV sporulation protein FB
MFAPVSTTPYDLRFRLFGVPVHVTPWFWAAGVFMGWDLASERRFDLLLIWLGSLFASILVHEYGHAFSAELFGCDPEIFLYHFGGLAVFRPNSRFSTWRSVVVSFAGPAAGFLLFGLVLASSMFVFTTNWYAQLSPLSQERLHFFIVQMIWINLYWGLVNLLPVLPLDGGRISEAVLTRLRRYDGHRWSAILGAVVAGGMAALFAMIHYQYGAIFFGILCIWNVQALQRPNPW